MKNTHDREMTLQSATVRRRLRSRWRAAAAGWDRGHQPIFKNCRKIRMFI